MPNIAIFIDAENVEPMYAGQIFGYAESIGRVAVKEIYGAGIALNEWAYPILQYAIHMNMTLRPNRYKNSSDIALVIGAMDLLARRGPSLNAAPGPGGGGDAEAALVQQMQEAMDKKQNQVKKQYQKPEWTKVQKSEENVEEELDNAA